ncbi:MAG: 3,4-dihydroxy-2-butanone-4-phosphate synthase [Thermoplasmata archaeon]|nr:3,4-dihydroxy-2-butanone-4-phosphate synthase [Thermoplasmata archaeon]
MVRTMLKMEAQRPVPAELAAAVRALDAGEPILIFDAPDREGETDLIILSERATPELIRLLRKDAGGWICTAISDDLRVRLGLPFYADMLSATAPDYPILTQLRREQLRYDARSPFGLHVHHRATYTGIPDNDRATGVRAIGELARDAAGLSDLELQRRFVGDFSSPGHLPIIYAAPKLLSERKGHTELSVSLTRMGRLSESATVCEMLGDSGGAREPEAARKYAEAHGFEFLDGGQILGAWRTWASA